MPTPCSVCAHLERASIDERLSLQVVNVAAVARSYGLGKDAMRTHRLRHLPQFLPAFKASAAALTLGSLQAEAQRLYEVTLDALARAEAGVLTDVDRDGKPVREVSMGAIARFIKEARQGLGLLAKLSADAGIESERPAGIADGELSARISAALLGTMERARGGPTHINDAREIDTLIALPIDGNAVECIDPGRALAGPPATTTPGSTSAGKPDPSPPQVPQSSGTPPGLAEDKPDILAYLRGKSVEEIAEWLTNEGFARAHERTRKVAMMRHPEWPGSPAASGEERRAEGYADIPIDDHVTPSDAILKEQLRQATEWAEEKRRRLEADYDSGTGDYSDVTS